MVMLIYCFLMCLFPWKKIPTALGVWIFSILIEILQYYNIVKVLGLQENKVARVVIGTFFEWGDLVAYTLGTVVLLLLDNTRLYVKRDLQSI